MIHLPGSFKDSTAFEQIDIDNLAKEFSEGKKDSI